MREYDLPRYSARLPWSAPTNGYTLLLQAQRRRGAKLLDLTVSNPTEALANYPHGEIARVFGAVENFRYQPHAFGTPSAREAIARWYANHSIRLEAKRIALTASTSEAYSILFKLLCDPGDEVLIPQPSYPLFELLARAEGVKTAPYRLAFDGGWFLDFDSLRSALSARSRAIVVVNPNNPTGSYLRPSEAEELSTLAAEHGCALISDEVFMTYPGGAPAKAVPSLIGNERALTFSLNGLSKDAGMPQMKLAWIAVSGPAGELDSACANLDLLLDSYLSVGVPVQNALEPLWRIGSKIHARIASRIERNEQTLQRLADSALGPLPREGGWSSIIRLPKIFSEETWITKLLEEHQILVHPGYFFDMAEEAYVVVSLLTDPAEFEAGIAGLKRMAELV